MYLKPTFLMIISLITYIPMRQTEAKDAEHTTVATAMIQNAHATILYRIPSAIPMTDFRLLLPGAREHDHVFV